jgi:hypothetical protein
MKFFNFFRKKNSRQKKFLGFLIKERSAVIIMMDADSDKRLRILDQEKISFSNGWDNIVEDADEAIFKIENRTKQSADEAIFFVYSHLVDEKNHDIKKTYLSKIKDLVRNLELKPLGFIECQEAVAKYLEKKEDVRLTAILIEFDEGSLGVFVYKVGQLSFSSVAPRTDSLTNDLSTVFGQAKEKTTLPSRIIIYNSKGLDDEAAKILTHHWQGDLFIQLPKVEIIKEETITDALIEVFSAQSLSETSSAPLPEKKEEKEVLGFVINQDIKEEGFPPPVEKKQTKKHLSFDFSKLPHPEFLFKGKLVIPAFKSSRKIAVFIGLFLIVLSVLINEIYFHKVDLTVFVPTDNVEKELELTAGVDGGVDMALKISTVSADFSQSKTTTGKKDIGTKAQGEVTVYNFNKEKTLAKGTVIESKGIKFALDNEVKVASATGNEGGRFPGKTNVKVTALQIGTESNLNKGQTFAIESLDSYFYYAKNESDFSGGTKKTVQTVSKQDLADLDSLVMRKVKEDGQGKNLPVSANEKIINDLTQTSLDEKKYSKEVGEEASSVALSARADTVYYTYDKPELVNILYGYFSKQVRTGYILPKQNISYQIGKVKEEKGAVDMKIGVKGIALKDVDKGKILELSLGKDKDKLTQIMKDNFAVSGLDINLKQPLPIPFLNNRLPFFKNNVKINIQTL